MPFKKATLVYTLLTVVFAAVTVYLVRDYINYDDEREATSMQLGRDAGQRVADVLDAKLAEVQARVHEYAPELAAIDDRAALLESLRTESAHFDLILGVSVAFEPGRFVPGELYAPFFNTELNEFQFIEDSYDYTQPGFETTKWYTTIAESGKAQWSDPFFGEATESLLVGYGVPLFDGQGEFMGMIIYIIRLSDLTSIMNEISVGESGYGFIFEQENGEILSHPNPSYYLQTVYELRDGKDEETLRRLKDEPEGIVAYNSTYTYKYSWFFFRELAATGWKSVLVFAEDDLLGAADDARRKVINIALGISLLLITLLALGLRVEQANPAKLWRMMIAVSLIIVGNIVVIWYLNLSTDFSHFNNDNERVVNKSIMDKYVSTFDESLYRLTKEPYRKVPTGVFIESYETTAFEAKLIGKLWMKYPKDLIEVAPPAFYFPDVSALEARGLVSEKISEVEYDDYILVTWRFRATLEQSFSYQQYPFEQNDIRLNMLYPDFSKNILLVPDLDSYDILNPSVKPGVNASIETPSSETIGSFFTFRILDYKTSFGNSGATQEQPVLSFNMAAKRIWLSPFIANIVPVLIIALIMFIVLCISFGQQAQERAGLTTMNVIQSSAGFLFILLLAHVNERARIETPEIAYIELFYFSMYLFITLQTVLLAMLFSGVNSRAFTWAGGRLLMLMFWPVLLSTWFVLTLVRFY